MLGLLPACAQPPGSSAIALDGRWEDWGATTPALVDPADATEAEVDIGAIRAVSDGQWVHLQIELGRTVNVQGLDGWLELLVDADGDVTSGRTIDDFQGIDVVVTFSPRDPERPQRRGMGVGLASTTYEPDADDPQHGPLSPYDAGIVFAPTYASDRVEIRLARGVTLPETPVLFAGAHFRARLVMHDGTGAPADRTDVVEVAIPPLASGASDLAGPAIPSPPGSGALRAMTWNVEHGSLMIEPEPFIRVLRALDPDIVLLQEMAPIQRADRIAAFFNEHLPGPEWQAIVGAGGGDLNCAIATRLPIQPIDAWQPLTDPAQPQRAIRIAGAFIETPLGRLLVISGHLRCCGRIGSREDDSRIADARTICSAIDTLRHDERFSGLLIGGDLNLVGSREPLDTLAGGVTAPLGPLRVLPSMRLNRSSNATWSDPGQPFVPGRLDFLLLSPGPYESAGAFVLDTAELGDNTLRDAELKRDDTANASDHLPVIVDLIPVDG